MLAQKLSPSCFRSSINARLQPEQANIFVRSARVFANVCLTLLSYDLYAIYRGGYEDCTTSSFRHYMSPKLRMSYTGLDLLLKKWFYVIQTFQTYCAVKFALILSVQIFYKIESGGGAWFWLAAYLADIVGTPLLSVFGLSLLVYSTSVVSTFYFFIYEPIQRRQKALDCIYGRMIMDPHREIRRIDLLIQEKLDSMLELVELRRNSFKSTWLAVATKNKPPNPDQLQREQIRLDHKIRHLILHEKALYWTMRPAAYYSNNVKAFNRVFLFGLAALLTSSSLFGLFLPRILLNISLDKRCVEFKLQECNPWTAYSLSDGLSLIELAFGLFQSGFIFNILVMGIMMSFSGSRINNWDLRNDLKTKLKHFRQVNEILAETDQQTLSSLQFGLIERHDLELSLDTTLIRILVKTGVILDDLRRTATYSTDSIRGQVVIASSIILAALVAAQLDAEMVSLRVLLVVIVWTVTNVVCLWSAYLFARTVEMDKLCWSIQAETMRRNLRRKLTFPSNKIETMWHRFILNGMLYNERFSIRLFGSSLNYTKVLKLNFTIISVAALLQQHLSTN